MKMQKTILDPNLSTEDMAKEILVNIIQLVNNGVIVKLDKDVGEGTITLYIGRTHIHCGALGATIDELIKDLHSALVVGKGLYLVHCSEYQSGHDVIFKNPEDGVWVKGEITGIYYNNERDCEILEINDGEYFITHEGDPPIVIL